MTRPIVFRIAYAVTLCALILLGLVATGLLHRRHRHDRLMVRAGRKYGVDPRLLAAVVWTESRFNPDAVGQAGELGLMQLMEPAAREWAESQHIQSFTHDMMLDPRANLEAGAWYLGRAINHWAQYSPDPLPFALAEYNAGRSRVRQWRSPEQINSRMFIEQIPFPSTKRYVETILTQYRGGP